jgi:hypothetical protein
MARICIGLLLWVGLSSAYGSEVYFTAFQGGTSFIEVRLILNNAGDKIFLAQNGKWREAFRGRIDSLVLPESRSEVDWGRLVSQMPRNRRAILRPTPITWQRPNNFFLQIRDGNDLTIANVEQSFELRSPLMDNEVILSASMPGRAQFGGHEAALLSLASTNRNRLFLYFDDQDRPMSIAEKFVSKPIKTTLDANFLNLGDAKFSVFEIEFQKMSREDRDRLQRPIDELEKAELSKQELAALLIRDFDQIPSNEYEEDERVDQLKLAAQTVEYMLTVEHPGVLKFPDHSRAQDAVPQLTRDLARLWLSGKIKSDGIRDLIETSLEALPRETPFPGCSRFLTADKSSRAKDLRTAVSLLKVIRRALYQDNQQALVQGH